VSLLRKIYEVGPRSRLTLDKAQDLLQKRGMKIDFSSSQVIDGETHYNVIGKGKVTLMSAKEIQAMLSK
jgi:cyanophycinase-like exopeptidase